MMDYADFLARKMPRAAAFGVECNADALPPSLFDYRKANLTDTARAPQQKEDAMTDADNRPAVAGQVERPVRPAADARWYCLDRDGVAMLCKDEADALAQAIENDDCWPARAPHRAALLCDLEYLRDGGDFIPLAQPRHEQAKRTAELCLSAWATARMDALEAQNAALKREAHTWSKAAEAYAKQAQRTPLDLLDVEELWDKANADDTADEVHHAFARLLERAHGIGA